MRNFKKSYLNKLYLFFFELFFIINTISWKGYASKARYGHGHNPHRAYSKFAEIMVMSACTLVITIRGVPHFDSR